LLEPGRLFGTNPAFAIQSIDQLVIAGYPRNRHAIFLTTLRKSERVQISGYNRSLMNGILILAL
jgi:hypothetical protein